MQGDFYNFHLSFSLFNCFSPAFKYVDSPELLTHISSHAPTIYTSQAALVVLKNTPNAWSGPNSIRKIQCLLYPSQLLIMKSSDCHPNHRPRPPKYPCLSCRRAVRNNLDSEQCESCEQCCHSECLSMSLERFNILVECNFA